MTATTDNILNEDPKGKNILTLSVPTDILTLMRQVWPKYAKSLAEFFRQLFERWLDADKPTTIPSFGATQYHEGGTQSIAISLTDAQWGHATDHLLMRDAVIWALGQKLHQAFQPHFVSFRDSRHNKARRAKWAAARRALNTRISEEIPHDPV
jgi:hypothetical protein